MCFLYVLTVMPIFMKRPFLTLLITAICLQTIAQVYTSPELEDRKKNQKTMAILPALAPVEMTRRQLKDLSPEQIMAMQDNSSLAFQKTLYTWLTTKGYGNTLEVQDPVVTDSLLAAAHLSVKDVIYGQKTDIARVLGVDVLLSASVHSQEDASGSTYMGAGGSMYVGPDFPTLQITLNMAIYDGQDGDRLWEYEGERNGGYERYADKKTMDKLIARVYKMYPYKRN